MASVEDASRNGGNDPPAPEIIPAAADSLDLIRLIEEHHAALYRYAFRLTGQQADAEDLLQQVFLVAQQKLHQVRSAASARAWLYAVLRSRFYKSQRRRRPERASDWELDLDQLPGDEEATQPWLAEIDEEDLRRALEALPEPFRVVVLMFYFEEASYREIADQLEVPMGTVMSRLARARQHLRASLAAETETKQEQTEPRRLVAKS